MSGQQPAKERERGREKKRERKREERRRENTDSRSIYAVTKREFCTSHRDASDGIESVFLGNVHPPRDRRPLREDAD